MGRTHGLHSFGHLYRVTVGHLVFASSSLVKVSRYPGLGAPFLPHRRAGCGSVGWRGRRAGVGA